MKNARKNSVKILLIFPVFLSISNLFFEDSKVNLTPIEGAQLSAQFSVSIEEIISFMDENERALSENPFERKSKSRVIIPEKNIEEKSEKGVKDNKEETNNQLENSTKSKEDKKD